MPLDSLERLRDWLLRYADEWTVLLWARHPVSYTTSNIQQHIKTGKTLEELVAQPPLPYLKQKASNAFTIFGRENVRLTAFEDAKEEPGGVVAAFCRRLGLPEETAIEIGASAAMRNESMSMLATLLFSSLNRQRPRFVDGQMNPQRARREVRLLQRIRGEKFQLSSEAECDIRRKSRADVEWLNATFGTQHYLGVLSDAEGSLATESGAYSPETIDSLSLLISDLLNRREINTGDQGRGLVPWWHRWTAWRPSLGGYARQSDQ